MDLRPMIVVSLLTLATTAAAADKPSASGTFEYNSKKYTPVHAVAFHEGPFLKVVLSDKPFDPALGRDGSYTDSDLMAHPSASFTITMDAADKSLFGIRFRDDKGSGADFRCEGPDLLKVSKVDASAVVGTFKCQEHDVKFDAPMLTAPGK